MRVTPNITSQNSLYNLQLARTRMDALGEKIASGKNTNRPSDDPVATRLLLGIGDRLTAADQYSSNISKADTWFKMSDAAISTMYTSLADVRSKISTAASGNATADDRNNAVYYVQMMKETLVDLGNTDTNGVYLFGGTKNLQPPYIASTGDTTSGSTTITNVDNIKNMAAGMEISGPGIVPGTKITAVTAGPPSSVDIDTAATANNLTAGFTVYTGDSNKIKIEINKGSSEAMNLVGNQFLTPQSASQYGSVDILKTFDQLIVDLKSNNLDGINQGLQALDDGAKQLISAQTDLQSRQVRFDTASKMNDTVVNTLKTVLSNSQEVDYAQLGVELQQQQTAFQAALSATAKISQMSLLDYL
nr:putative flagellar hook-associated protein 3 [uncultured bacterium]